MFSGCRTVLCAERVLHLCCPYNPVPIKRPLADSTFSFYQLFSSSLFPHRTLSFSRQQHPSLHSSASSHPCPHHRLPPSSSGTPRHSFIPRSLSSSVRPAGVMDLKEVLDVLEQLAPLSLAESWDNVGLLVEPSKPRPIKTILLTNDLTMPVMDEAEAMDCDLIISYHPPLFQPMKRLVQKDWKQRLAVRAVENGMAVYAPHTSWDSIKGGVNDWLIGGMGSGSVSVLSQALSSAPQRHKLEFCVRNQEQLNVIMADLRETETSNLQHHTTVRSEPDGYHVSVTCAASALTPCVQMLVGHAAVSPSLSITQLQPAPLLGCGQGRMCVLDEPVTVAMAVQRMKSHLGLPHLRLALGHQRTTESSVSTVAVCAGSGASVLQGVKADLYITGEMSHHEVLDAVAKGTSVILSDHSNSERGFLAMFKERLTIRLPESVTVAISKSDRDPLEVV
ncbi:NIF3-like protein 1 [Clupea harengus]|uniref:NIF3-like protein 1 n=1 Tax=Clupea harengus TaxID=7950 RepID=A0A6P8FEQ4_CLUHA|nr:NIF3-like protein 1 [Clupea harengus]XP_012693186.1 NIF3-like protein 1 [Clupea harengus]XP_031424089.1 NIF3-like protein 1 [Clupea harengus]XP_042563582.1 NIF3-like protein 1 [Clupea harengus]